MVYRAQELYYSGDKSDRSLVIDSLDQNSSNFIYLFFNVGLFRLSSAAVALTVADRVNNIERCE